MPGTNSMPTITPIIMTTKETILFSLSKFQATTDVVAQDLCQPPTVVAAFCEDIEAKGLIENTLIGGHIKGWRITEAGREHIASFLESKKNQAICKS